MLRRWRGGAKAVNIVNFDSSVSLGSRVFKTMLSGLCVFRHRQLCSGLSLFIHAGVQVSKLRHTAAYKVRANSACFKQRDIMSSPVKTLMAGMSLYFFHSVDVI